MSGDTPHIEHAVALFRSGDIAGARADLTEHLSRTPDDAEAWLTLGLISVRGGLLNDGLMALRRVIRVLPLEPSAYDELSAAYRLAADSERAEECSMSARALWQRGEEFQGRYAESLAYQASNDYESVVACLRPIAAALPACAAIHKALADFLHASDKLKTMSARFAARILNDTSSDRDTSILPDEIREAYRIAIRHDPEWSEARTYFANFLNEIGNVEEALEQYHAAVRYAPDDPIARFNLALILEKSGDVVASVAQAEAAVRLFSAFGEAHECIGRLIQASNPSSAAGHFSLALRQARFHTTSANL